MHQGGRDKLVDAGGGFGGMLIGWGLFARFAWTPDPEDRNMIDQFYSFGVGGRGCLIPGRDLDFWGLGWAGTHISGDLRDDLAFLNVEVDLFEGDIRALQSEKKGSDLWI